MAHNSPVVVSDPHVSPSVRAFPPQPLYNDYRRVRLRTPNGYQLTHIDEFIETLLTKDFACDIALPRIPHRWTLEAAGQLEPRRSVLEDEDVDIEQEEIEGEARM